MSPVVETEDRSPASVRHEHIGERIVRAHRVMLGDRAFSHGLVESLVDIADRAQRDAELTPDPDQHERLHYLANLLNNAVDDIEEAVGE